MAKNFLVVLSAVIAFTLFLLIPSQYASGHGLGFEKISSIKIGERELSVMVEMLDFTDKFENKQIKISAIDDETEEFVPEVTFLISLYQDDKLLFQDNFLTPTGELILDVKPSEDEQTKIIGQKNSNQNYQK